MDYTRTADAFSQVKAEIVVAGGEVLLVGDGFSELGMTWCFIGEEFAAGFDVMDYYVIWAQPAPIYHTVFAQGV